MAEITKMWIADKMREIMKHKPIDNITSAETVVQMMFKSMPEDLRKIFFRDM